MTLSCIWWWGSSSDLGNVEYPLLSLLQGSLWPEMEVPVRVPSMNQIHLFKIISIGLKYMKPYNYK